MPLTIGVLALQGAFREHITLLQTLNVNAKEVKLPKDFENIDGLVIPGILINSKLRSFRWRKYNNGNSFRQI